MPYLPLRHAGRIHYAERGEKSTAPSALLIHGSGASSAIWSMVLARVAQSGHAVAIDLPGHGPSEAAGAALDGSTGLTLARYRDAVGELAGALCLGPSVLVGHSLGGLVALEAALAWPDKVRALVLCASAPRLRAYPELVALLRDDPDRAAIWLADHALSPSARAPVRRGFILAGSVTPPDITRADFAMIEGVDLGARLGEIRCPITWIDGADDRIVPPELRGDRPGEIIELPGVGHVLPIEAPGAVADAIGNVVRGVG